VDVGTSPGAATHARADAIWIALLVAAFVFGLAASWQRWGNPLIDTGREMNQPVRLLAGETLYSDVRHIYGPLSPWLHAALYKTVGPSLSVLYADGILCAAAVLGLLFWIGRQIMSPAAAGAATLSVMWLCVFKPAGNYILPYSYNAVHGTLLGLVTLCLVVAALKAGGTRPRPRTLWVRFIVAGLTAGLTILAKTEMGLAACSAGLVGAVLAGFPGYARGLRHAAVFAAPAILLPAVVYAVIAADVGWNTLFIENWLALFNAPPELALFNSRISGFDHPARSVERMIIAAVKLVILGAAIGSVSTMVATRRTRSRASSNTRLPASDVAAFWRPGRVLAGAALLFAALAATTGLDWDKGPYLAMPVVLVMLIILFGHRYRTARAIDTRDAILITCCVYALVSLARTILHVRSGGAYGAYLLPVSVVMFTYAWMHPFAERLRLPEARRLARLTVLTLLIGDAVITAGMLAYRYRTRQTTPIVTARGTIIASRDLGQAWNEAIAYIAAHTPDGSAVAVLPEGTSINFLADRRNPLREEITTPGFLDAAGEARAIRQLQENGTALILLTNRPTREFGPEAFGRDYCQRLMRWIEDRYVVCAMFGPVKDRRLQIGDPRFFIRAYCPR
jgi:hypothetical protein